MAGQRTTSHRGLTSNKDLRAVFKQAAAYGCSFRKTGKSHVLIYTPDPAQRPVTASCSPSDHRTLKNTVAALRRAGVPL